MKLLTHILLGCWLLDYKVQYHPDQEIQLALTYPQPCPRALSKSPKAITGILNISNYMYIHVFQQFAFKCCHFTYNNHLNMSFVSVTLLELCLFSQEKTSVCPVAYLNLYFSITHT